MPRQKTSRKPSGHPGPNGRPNGRAPAYEERGGTPAPACACPPWRASRLRGHAASDDASGISVASAEALPATASLPSQASTGRQAYAAAAPPLPNETMPTCASCENVVVGAKDEHEEELPEGNYPLPDNPAEFVEEIHRKVDLTEVWHRLLRSKDEKVRQRAIEKLTGMLYEDGALSSDDPRQIIFDLPRPKRD